jgi:hypothetical protein
LHLFRSALNGTTNNGAPALIISSVFFFECSFYLTRCTCFFLLNSIFLSPSNSPLFFNQEPYLWLSIRVNERMHCAPTPHLPTSSPRIERKREENGCFIFLLSHNNVNSRANVLYPRRRKRKENDRAEIRTTFLLTASTRHTHTHEENDGKNQQWALHHRPLFICRSFSRSPIIKREKEKDRKERKKKHNEERITYRQTSQTTYGYKCRRHASRKRKREKKRNILEYRH